MMGYAIQWLRSLAFVIQMYLMMPLMAIVFVPWAMLRRDGVYTYIRSYADWVRWTARWMVGLRTEIRGEIPTDQVLVASKHQSFLDVVLLVSALPRSRFIIKKELHNAPIFHFFGKRMGNVPVDRGKRREAIAQMMADVQSGRNLPGQLVIYPQGTRIHPCEKAPYKVGVGLLYEQTGYDCVPAATNVGLFWPKRAIYRRPGTAVLEFLPRIPAGLPKEEFMQRLEEVIETNSNRLMREAGFDPEKCEWITSKA